MKILFVFVFLYVHVALAVPVAGPISQAMGGSGRAAVDPVESLFLNPAAIGLVNKYFLGLSHYHDDMPTGASWSEYGVVLTDGSPDSFTPASFAYRYARYNINLRQARRETFRGGLGYSWRRFTFGAAYHQANHKVNGLSDEEEHQVDLGALWAPTDKLGFGLVAQNILSENQNVFTEIRERSQLGVGVTYVEQRSYSLRWDIIHHWNENNKSRLIHQFGLGSEMINYLHFRAGFEINDYEGQSRYSLGLAWEGPRLKLAYAFQQSLRGEVVLSRHFVDLWLNF